MSKYNDFNLDLQNIKLDRGETKTCLSQNKTECTQCRESDWGVCFTVFCPEI